MEYLYRIIIHYKNDFEYVYVNAENENKALEKVKDKLEKCCSYEISKQMLTTMI